MYGYVFLVCVSLINGIEDFDTFNLKYYDGKDLSYN